MTTHTLQDRELKRLLWMILFLWPLLAVGATNAFYFVVTASKPFRTTNLTPKVTFSRVVLEGGKLADVAKQVTFKPADK